MNVNYTLSVKMYMLSKEPSVKGTSFYHEGPTAIFFNSNQKGWDYHENCDVEEEFGLAILQGWKLILDVCNYLKEQEIKYIGVDPVSEKFMALPIDRFIRDVADRRVSKMWIALLGSGTIRSSPFFVSRKMTSLLFRLTFLHSSFRISPRRPPVYRLNNTKGRILGVHSANNRSNSSGSR